MIGILEIEWIGRGIKRWSTQSYESATPLLEIDSSQLYLGEEGSLPGAQFPESRSIDFSISSIDEIHVKSLIASIASFYIFYEGIEHLVCKGRCSDVSWNPLTRKIVGRISRSIVTPRTYGGAQSIISPLTFPRDGTGYSTGILPYLTIGGHAAGKFYPTVIGIPGRDTPSPIDCLNLYSSLVPGSPAYLVESGAITSPGSHTFLISEGDVEAQEVVLFSKSRSESPGVLIESSEIGDNVLSSSALDLNVSSVQKGVDKLGRAFSYVTCSEVSGTASWEAWLNKGDEFWIKWCNKDGTLSQGGIKNPYGDGTLSGAGDLIRWCANMSGISLDESEVSSLDAFNDIKIDTYINEPINLWDWALSRVLPLTLSISGISPRGAWVRPIPQNFRDKRICVKTLTKENSYIDGDITYDNIEDVVTHVSLSYAPLAHVDNTFCKVIRETPLTSSLLQTSRQICDSDSELVLEIPEIYSDASASKIISSTVFWRGQLWARARWILSGWNYIPRVGDMFWDEERERAQLVISWRIDASGTLSLLTQFPL